MWGKGRWLWWVVGVVEVRGGEGGRERRGGGVRG